MDYLPSIFLATFGGLLAYFAIRALMVGIWRFGMRAAGVQTPNKSPVAIEHSDGASGELAQGKQPRRRLISPLWIVVTLPLALYTSLLYFEHSRSSLPTYEGLADNLRVNLGDIEAIEREIKRLSSRTSRDYGAAYFWSLVGARLDSGFAKRQLEELETKLNGADVLVSLQAAASQWKPSTAGTLLTSLVLDEKEKEVAALLCKSRTRKSRCAIPRVETGEGGWTILMFATSTGNKNIVSYLAERYPQMIQAEADDGTTAAILAAYLGFTGVLEQLRGPASLEFFVQNRLGVSAYDAALAAGHDDSVQLMNRVRSQFFRAVQTRLQSAGYYTGTIDGIPGPNTNLAVHRFRRDASMGTEALIDRTFLNRLF